MRAPKLERSGVMVRDIGACCGRRMELMELALGLGVDQAKVAGALSGAAGLFGVASQAASKGFVDDPSLTLTLPWTRRSKSSSPSVFPPLALAGVKPATPPNDMKSSFVDVACVELESSCSFLVCSCSTLEERSLMSSMNDWNCFKLSKGPRLIVQRTGRISIAMNSVSATLPTCLRTLSAANITPGSFVLMPLIRGKIFSCIVYLSNAVVVTFFLLPPIIPSSPSSIELSEDPPHSVTNASSPRTLIPRLLVLVNTDAITGNSSFFIVLKSRTGRIVGRLLNAASTTECVEDSIARWIIGSISIHG